MKTKVDIISGFLGAGKTTLIKKLIEENLHNEKLVIIENEFGKVGIDGEIFKKSNIEVKEINSGCICCTLAGDFEIAISEVLTRFGPDRIIIEPSGVGKLSDVIKACQSPKIKDLIAINMLIVIVDALKYRIFIANFGEFFENQIRHAKTIIFSRTQDINDTKLESITKDIRSINENANIITTPWENLNSGLIIGVAEQNENIAFEQHLYPHNHSADEVFDVWSTETPRVFAEEEINDILKILESDKSLGNILRGKGILQIENGTWLQFDFVPGEIRTKKSSADYSGRLCIIGTELAKNSLIKLFNLL